MTAYPGDDHRQRKTTSLASLSEESQERIAAYLLGVELFALSHVSSDALETFSQEQLWTSRLTSIQDTHQSSSKRRYIQQCQSFSFPGRSRGEDGQLTPDPTRAYVAVGSSMRDAFGSWGTSFSFETWFSLSSSGDGGVLLGAQSTALRQAYDSQPAQEPSSYAQLVYVDAERNLFCSVVNCTRQDRSPVAQALELHRWYHLALVYEKNRGESVYLSGDLVNIVEGSLPTKWRSLYAAHIGTGYMTTASLGSSSPKAAGWLDFHGVVDSFQVFRFALSTDSVRRFAASERESGDEGGGELDEPTFCLKQELPTNSNSSVQRVRCSRPHERWCHAIPGGVREESLDSLLDMI